MIDESHFFLRSTYRELVKGYLAVAVRVEVAAEGAELAVVQIHPHRPQRLRQLRNVQRAVAVDVEGREGVSEGARALGRGANEVQDPVPGFRAHLLVALRRRLALLQAPQEQDLIL